MNLNGAQRTHAALGGARIKKLLVGPSWLLIQQHCFNLGNCLFDLGHRSMGNIDLAIVS